MAGITCSFWDIPEYVNLPIKYIQILFEERKNGPITVPLNRITEMGKLLQSKGITPYLHIDLRINVFTSYNYQSQKRLQWLSEYANCLNIKGCIIQCGLKGNTLMKPIYQ